MSSELHALRYLTPAEDSFWEWSDDGEVVISRGGVTLAYRSQLELVLAHFAERGLPPFELVLLILLACRDNWVGMKAFVQHSLANSSRQTVKRPIMKQWWDTLFQALDRVHALPQQMRANPAEHRTIIEIAFERLPRATDSAQEVIDILSQPHWLRKWVLPEPLVVPVGERTQLFSAVTQGLLKLTVDEVLTRTATGLNAVPEAPEELQEQLVVPEVLAARTVSQLLEELRDDDEHRELVRLVRTLSAVLTLPRDLSTPEELPQGGVSDITNRGPLDRLLLSELANDDDTLMTRVALNEALYMRRESPPAHPMRDRVMLIDAGIRMWGLPRVCASVVGLCLASQNSSGLPARVFCVGPKGMQPVDFTSRDGLLEHLATLSHEAHPGESLSTWLDEADQDAAVSIVTDRIIITGEDVLADPVFRCDLRTNDVLPAYIVTVNRAGRVRLFRETAIGEKQLKELWLDLDGITGAKQQPEKSLIDKTVNERLPAILRLPQLPLRLGYPHADLDSFALLPRSAGDGSDLLQVTRDQRLLLWDSPYKGARQVTDRLPPGKLRWFSEPKNDGTVSLVLTRNNGEVHLVHVRSNTSGSIEYESEVLKFWHTEDERENIVAVTVQLVVLLFITRTHIIAVYLESGQRLASIQIPEGMRWIRGRSFKNRSHEWLQVSYFAGEFLFDVVLNAQCLSLLPGIVLGFVGPPDDPHAVLDNGCLYSLRNQLSDRWGGQKSYKNAVLTSVSPNGNRFVVLGRSSPLTYELVTLGSPIQAMHSSTPPTPAWLFGSKGEPSDKLLFKKLSRLAGGQSLLIVTRNGCRLVLAKYPLSSGPICLRNFTGSDGTYLDSSQVEEIASPAGVGYTLQQVAWSDGSRGIIDSRGMLHLQSSDREIPEVTLVLSESHVSGWSSDGRHWGLGYFLDERALGGHPLSTDEAMQYIQRFLERLP